MNFHRKPTHPGAVLLEDVLLPLGLTVTEAAKRFRVPRRALSVLLHEQASLSPAMAVRIAKATKTTPESGCTCRRNWIYGMPYNAFQIWKMSKLSNQKE